MKTLFIFLVLSVLFYSCIRVEPVEKRYLIFLYVDEVERVVYMNDTSINEIVRIKYDAELFDMTFIEVCQIKGNPVFTFLYSDGCYYHN